MKVLMIHPDKCTGCRNCELAYSVFHENEFRPRVSRVHAYSWEREGLPGPLRDELHRRRDPGSGRS